MGREGDFGAGGRPAGRIPQRGLDQKRPRTRRGCAREAEEQPLRPHFRDGGRHVRASEVRHARPDAVLRTVLRDLLRHLPQRCGLRTDPAPGGALHAAPLPRADDAPRRLVRHAVRAVHGLLRPDLRVVLRPEPQGVFPCGAVLRLPGALLLGGAGHRCGPDSLRHAAARGHDHLYARLPLLVRRARMVHRGAVREPGRGASDARPRVGHSPLRGFVAGFLCGAGRGRRADARAQHAGPQSAGQFRCGTVGFLQQPHGHPLRRAVVHPTVRHRTLGRHPRHGLQRPGTGSEP